VLTNIDYCNKLDSTGMPYDALHLQLELNYLIDFFLNILLN